MYMYGQQHTSNFFMSTEETRKESGGTSTKEHEKLHGYSTKLCIPYSSNHAKNNQRDRGTVWTSGKKVACTPGIKTREMEHFSFLVCVLLQSRKTIF